MQTYDFAGRETVTLVTAPGVLRLYGENLATPFPQLHVRK